MSHPPQGQPLPHFPQLIPDEYNDACHNFDQKYVAASLGPERRLWRMHLHRSILNGPPYLEIQRPLDIAALLVGDGGDGGDLVDLLENLCWGGEGGGMLDAANIDVDTEMGDVEALRDQRSIRDDTPTRIKQGGSIDIGEVLPQYSVAPKQPWVKYEIHYHHTYRVPCLWFELRDLPPCDQPWDVETIMRRLIPEQFKPGVRQMGVAHVMSVQPNPVTGVPSWFLHPCQTTEAMAPFRSACTTREYIQIWLGLMGPCVGLQVPIAMGVIV